MDLRPTSNEAAASKRGNPPHPFPIDEIDSRSTRGAFDLASSAGEAKGRVMPGRDQFLEGAIAEARTGLREGGIPIGCVLLCDGRIIGRGRNQRVQGGSVIHHAEMNCLENAGRQPASVYQRCTIYSTLSPCPMCSGAIVLYKIPRVVIGENTTFLGAEDYLRANGIKVEVLQDEECIQMMRDFSQQHPDLWNEDIGV